MVFKLNLRWGVSVQQPPLSTTNSSPWPSSYSFKGREDMYDSARMSFGSAVYWEAESLYVNQLRAHSSSAAHILENDNLENQETKMEVVGGSQGIFHVIENNIQKSTEEDKSIINTSLQATKDLHFSLLMKNLHLLEGSFADSESLRLEKDIMVHLKRLGALELFHMCLSRTARSSTMFDLPDSPDVLDIEHRRRDCVPESPEKVIIRSGKKEERRSRRKRASEKLLDNLMMRSNSNIASRDHAFHKPSSGRRPSKLRRKRIKLTRNEAEMSGGIKMIASLERIKTRLEEETAQVPSLNSWAEAAGVENKILQQHLHFGWYCRDELLTSTRALVIYLARNYRGLGVAFEDLIQAGNMGVMQGAERFDPTRGYKFSTYVQYWIRKSMSMLVARHARGIRVPFTLSKVINQVQKARKILSISHRKCPEDTEVAKFTGLTTAKIMSASKCLRVVGSIDQKVGDSTSAKLLEYTADASITGPDEAVLRKNMVRDVHTLLEGLEPRERQVLILRFGLKNHQRQSLEEIGRQFCVSKEWIRKIERRALAKLKDEETLLNLKHYLYM